MFSPPVIKYIVVDDRAPTKWLSQFQEFRLEWLALYPTLGALLRCPTSLVDIAGTTGQRLRVRAHGVGRLAAIVLPVEYLADLPLAGFVVVVSTPAADAAARKHCKDKRPQVLHLPSNPHSGEVGIDDVTLVDFQRWHQDLLTFLDKTDPWAAGEVRFVLNEIATAPARDSDKEPTPLRGDGTLLTMPNDLALLAVGYDDWEKTQAPESQDDVARSIERSYSQIRAARDTYFPRTAYPPGTTELLLVSPGMVTALPDVIPRSHRDPGDDIVSSVYKDLRRSGGFVLPRHLAHPPPHIQHDKRAMRLIESRQAELESTILIAAIEAASQAIPTVPIDDLLPTHPYLARLVEQLRNRSKDWRTSACLHAQALGAELAKRLPAFVVRDLVSMHGTVKVMSDYPLELAQVVDRPLCARHAIVRLPVTPGFLLERLMERVDPQYVVPSDFDEVLVLRMTLPDDPVYRHLEHFCDRVSCSITSVSIRIVDVRTVEQMADELSRFSGAMVVIDAHGFHPARGPGRLVFHGGAANPLESERGLRVPPIVFLAACDTHAADKGQETVALALLAAGARTVVGTLAPVGSLESAVLVAELLLAIRLIVPKYPGALRWSELFWMVASASHAGEAAMLLRNVCGLALTPEDVQRVNITAMQRLAAFQGDWLEKTWERIGELAHLPVERIVTLWRTTAYVTDSFLFTQLGHADSVFLAPTKEFVATRTGKRPHERD